MDQLRKFWERWKAFGHFMGNIVARVLLSIFYFTVFVPFGIGVRLLSDPLQIRNLPDTLWRPRTTADPALDEAKRQF